VRELWPLFPEAAVSAATTISITTTITAVTVDIETSFLTSLGVIIK
jgi:hypothetical protein